jgi:hypothetical protein
LNINKWEEEKSTSVMTGNKTKGMGKEWNATKEGNEMKAQ